MNTQEKQIKQNTPHQSDRVGRVGSADAKKIVQIAKRGFINSSDSEFLALIKGERENKEISSYYIELGNEIEDMIFEIIKTKYPDVTTNEYLRSDKLSDKYGFEVGFHPDYSIGLLTIECKTAILEDTNMVMDKYLEQLSFQYMILKELYGVKAKMMLCHYNTVDYDGVFDANRIKLVTLDTKQFNGTISLIKKGLEIISEALPSFVYQPKDELLLSSESLPIAMQDQFNKIRQMEGLLGNYLQEVKDFKGKMQEMMQSKGIKKIELEDLGFVITSVSDSTSTTFDKKSFEKSHPLIYKRFLRNEVRKGYAKIKFKDGEI